MSRGEELTIIQKDLGSGWTSVRNSEDQVLLSSFERTNLSQIIKLGQLRLTNRIDPSDSKSDDKIVSDLMTRQLK